MKTNETLKVAAVKVGDQIFTGETSVAAVRTFLRQPGDKLKKLESHRTAAYGFLTSEGRFVEHDEAALIAKRSGQNILFGALVEPPPEQR